MIKDSTVKIGHRAEQAAAEFLVRQGYTICEVNWRRRDCEIDIVAKKSDCLHFVEVKFRERDAQGAGLEYITPQKLRRLRFGARIYSKVNGWNGDVNIAAIEVSGPALDITGFIDSVTYDF